MQAANEADFLAWVDERPLAVAAAIREHAFRPWVTYRLRLSGRRVVLYSFDETVPVTVTVDVLAALNPLLAFERRVFGVSLADLLDPIPIWDVPGASGGVQFS